MSNWLTIALARNHEPNSVGLDDGGLSVGGKLFPGQSSLFAGPRKGRNVRKKIKHKKPERPGEQIDHPLFSLQ